MILNVHSTLDQIFKHPAVAELRIPPNQQETLVINLLHGNHSSRTQAEMLFVINEALQHTPGEDPLDKSILQHWTDVFAEAICYHVIRDTHSPRVLDDVEARWVLAQMSRPSTGTLSDAELSAIVLICATAQKTPPFFKRAVLLTIHMHILTERNITAETVNILSQVIFGQGGFDGIRASREEAELLLDVNTRASTWPGGGSDRPEWQEFFLETLRWHLLHDTGSPGTVDDAEAGWLAEWLRQVPPPLDPNTLRLLDMLNTEARHIPEFLEGEPEEVHGRISIAPPRLPGASPQEI